MTRPLSDWLNQRVRYLGCLEYWGPSPNRSAQVYLLKNVQIKPYKADDDSETRFVHHLWFELTKSPRHAERLECYCGIGDVIKYWRADGTEDYGISVVPTLDINEVMGWAVGGSHQEIYQASAKVVDLLETGTAMFSWSIGFSETYNCAVDVRDRANMQIEKQRRYDDAIAARSVGEITADPDRFRGRRRERAIGFASGK